MKKNWDDIKVSDRKYHKENPPRKGPEELMPGIRERKPIWKTTYGQPLEVYMSGAEDWNPRSYRLCDVQHYSNQIQLDLNPKLVNKKKYEEALENPLMCLAYFRVKGAKGIGGKFRKDICYKVLGNGAKLYFDAWGQGHRANYYTLEVINE